MSLSALPISVAVSLQCRKLDTAGINPQGWFYERKRTRMFAENPHSADNPLYTKRFAYFVGRRCRQAAIADVAKELALGWHTVKALEMQYMEAQLARAGTPGPQVIGIDEIA